jgi:hypothetical protein
VLKEGNTCTLLPVDVLELIARFLKDPTKRSAFFFHLVLNKDAGRIVQKGFVLMAQMTFMKR